MGLPQTLTEHLQRREDDRRALFRTYTDLRRQARDSEDFELHRLVAEAYRHFLRSFLETDERAFLDLQDEVAELRGELQQWRTGIKRSEA